MPNFDPAQDLGGPDATVQTVPLSLPNQFGAVVAGPPTNPNIAPMGNPNDQVINSAAIVDPKLRAAYELAHQPQAPAPVVPVAPGAPVAPSQVMPADQAAPPQVAPVIPIRPSSGGGGAPAPAQAPGGGIPGQLGDLDKQIATNQTEQEAALTNQGDVQAAGLAREAEAKSQAADIQRQQAADLAAQQQYVRDRQAELNEVDRQNLEQAKNKTIPDFWAGREGEHVGASIGVLLAGLGAGFLGSTQNQAVEVIQHNTDKYFDRKKEEIDNLYKYAQAQGLVNDKARDQYAKSITDLIQQHAAVLDAAKARVEAVATESQSDDAKARAAVLAKQLGDAAAKEHLGVADARIKWYDAQEANKTKLMTARAELIKANAYAEHERAAGGGANEKEENAAFQTYVKGPHGKEADEINRRVEALNSAHTDVDKARSIGEVVAQIDKAIAADSGSGTRGVSMGQLHSILPNLVSASGELLNKGSQAWDGTAGKEFKGAAKRMIDTMREGRLSERSHKSENLEKNLALLPHAQKNPAFAKTSRLQLYPDMGPSEAPQAAAKPKQMKVGNKVYTLQPDGNYL